MHNRHAREDGNPEVGFADRKSALHQDCFPKGELRKGLPGAAKTGRRRVFRPALVPFACPPEGYDTTGSTGAAPVGYGDDG